MPVTLGSSGITFSNGTTQTTAATGTVTSVAATNGTGISISGSPITSSGTLTITNTGVTSVTAGSGISVSAATGGVTITSTSSSKLVYISQLTASAGTQYLDITNLSSYNYDTYVIYGSEFLSDSSPSSSQALFFRVYRAGSLITTDAYNFLWSMQSSSSSQVQMANTGYIQPYIIPYNWNAYALYNKAGFIMTITGGTQTNGLFTYSVNTGEQGGSCYTFSGCVASNSIGNGSSYGTGNLTGLRFGLQRGSAGDTNFYSGTLRIYGITNS